MTNPFLRRATEYIRDDSAFLAIVSPEPLTTFVAKHKKRELLFDYPVRVIGTPGSGKTMMASLVEFRLIESILRDQSSENNRSLASVLARCGFTHDERPRVAGVRIPMESEYRDFWELPYEPAVKTKLVLALIQARTILELVRNLTSNRRRAINEIRFIPRDGAGAQLEQIGGADAESIVARARSVERAVYSIGASLLPPSLDNIPEEAREPYQPFEAIQEIEIEWSGTPCRLRPMTILDDVHTLHPDQFEALFRALARREIRFARWLMMRMDALSPSAVFRSAGADALPGLKVERDYLDIFMQTDSARSDERRQFRKMATDMADRYLRLVQPLRDRNYTRFKDLLGEEPPSLSAGQMNELRALIDREQKSLRISQDRQHKIRQIVDRYVKGAKSLDLGEDVRLMMFRVLLHRYVVRTTGQTSDLFADDPEPRQPLRVKSTIADAARLILNHKFNRAFHFGLDVLCDASNENAEVFLQLAGALVERMETKAIRNQDPALTPAQQQSALRDKSKEMLKEWRFPFARKVRALIDRFAQDCLEVSAEPNASLGAGANAVGIPETEMQDLLAGDSEIALVLKYAIAYQAIVAIRDYGQGGKNWCLLELSGPVCLAYGLTLNRGGFLERRVPDLVLAEEKV
ncbi:hypothetical protein [Bradyrhizobium algeriense]|uniref:hypothetical protein n=1 Tax=Bradyrhizobium algeriense TaxID=634784 RepID=UPI000D382123|nr:hypothetical protein [Bradyrhizobium algeriense]